MSEKTRQNEQKSVNFGVVTVATPFSDIVKWDQDPNIRLRFEPTPDLFRELSAKELGQLSQFGQYAYQIAREEYRVLSDETAKSDEDVLEQVLATYQHGIASERLRVRHEVPGFVYCWMTPDKVPEFCDARGYRVVKGGPERTLANSTGKGPHVIGRQGSEELILLRRTIEVDKAVRAEKKRRRMERRGRQDEIAKAKLEETGVRSLDEGTKANFTPISERKQ